MIQLQIQKSKDGVTSVMGCSKCGKRVSRETVLAESRRAIQLASYDLAIKLMNVGISEKWIQENLYTNA